MVHALIHAYKLHRQMDCIEPTAASEDDLRLFHSQYYLDYLKNECTADISQSAIDSNSDESEDNTSDVDDEQLNYGLGYDCPKIFNLWKFVRTIAGGTLTAADQLLNGRKTVINWCGGWHHAQR